MDTQLIALTFNPPADSIADILERLGDPNILLSDIAEKYETTLEALALWMARDDIAQRLADLQSAIAARVRLIATAALPKAAEALSLMIGEYTHEARYVPTNHGSLKAIQTRHRSRELTRKAAALLHRLTNFGRDSGLRPRFRSPRPKVLLPKTPQLPTCLPASQSEIPNPKSSHHPLTRLIPHAPPTPVSLPTPIAHPP